MKKYHIGVTHILVKIVEVEAESKKEAVSQVLGMVYDEQIKVTHDNHIKTIIDKVKKKQKEYLFI